MSQPAGKKPSEAFDLSRDPVKQYVRLNGWVNVGRQRLQTLSSQGKKRQFGLRYFTLCGKDALDIFLFQREGLIKDDERSFPSVCFCEDYYKSFVNIKSLLGRTWGKRTSFEEIVNESSFKQKVIQEPFDIVNLDFSGVCFPTSDAPYSRTLRSIHALIELQKKHEFDLFVTFKALRYDENKDAIDELTTNMEKNFNEIPDVKEKFITVYGMGTVRQLSLDDYGRFLLVTFPKIVFGFGSDNGFMVDCPLKFIYVRRRAHFPTGRTYQIVKFIFSFKSAGDSGSFSRSARTRARLTEAYKDAILIDLARPPIDVDAKVSQEAGLRNKLTADCKAILAKRKAFGL